MARLTGTAFPGRSLYCTAPLQATVCSGARWWQVRFQDKWLTTAIAHRTLIEGDVSSRGRK